MAHLFRRLNTPRLLVRVLFVLAVVIVVAHDHLTKPTHPIMLSRQLLPRIARPLTRLASSSSISSATSSVPAKEASSPSAAIQQAPNYPTTWSTSQRPRPQGQSGPRFEQTIMELQPNALSAMEMISKEPIRVVHGRKAVCDGGMFYFVPFARCALSVTCV